MEISLKSTSVYHTIIITMITTVINTEMLPLTSTQLAESRRSCIQNQGRTTSPDLNEIGKVIDWLWIRPYFSWDNHIIRRADVVSCTFP